MLVAEEFEHVAAKGIGSRLRREIDHAAIETPELGRRTVALDLELLDGVDDRVVRHLPRLGLEHGDAVEEIFVRSRSPTVDARQDGVRRQGHAGDDGGQHDEQAAVQRQLHDLFVLDDRPETRGLRPHDRRITDHGHQFPDIADAEVEIDADLFAGRQANALASHGLEPGKLDVEPVMAGRQARGGVDAIPGGHGYPLNAGSCLGDGNGGAGDGRPGLIFHPAGDLAGTRLGTGRPHADTPRARRRETD